MLDKISLFYSWLIWFITYFIPDCTLTMRMRGWLYSLAMPRSGSDFQVSNSTRIYGINKFSVGDHVLLATNVVINAGGEINIGNEVMIGIGSILVSGNHTISNGSYRFGIPKRDSIYIGDGSWLAAQVIVVSGASIPKSSLIAANTVVTKKLLTSGVYAGSPAKLIKHYN
ncbi:acyltransferase [Vibrio metschnikovii]|nr:acyltransferase [Vibrio metschnikovii]EKO3711584.1 acyltransferase [Vibrio metschnikovii]